jgi:hypothetical protein
MSITITESTLLICEHCGCLSEDMSLGDEDYMLAKFGIMPKAKPSSSKPTSNPTASKPKIAPSNYTVVLKAIEKIKKEEGLVSVDAISIETGLDDKEVKDALVKLDFKVGKNNVLLPQVSGVKKLSSKPPTAFDPLYGF